MKTSSLTPGDFRGALSHFATGVTVITAARSPERIHGMTANSLASVSLTPPLILVCIDQRAQMLRVLLEKRRFGINVLRSDQVSISQFFAQPEQPDADERALGIRFHWTAEGIPLLEDVLVQMECHVAASYVAGDHTIFVARVNSTHVHGGEPLLYFRCSYRTIAPAS
jgi:flavin reductase (DIM6/NTAB) family NADH-FMN oxidoreductase RutF